MPVAAYAVVHNAVVHTNPFTVGALALDDAFTDREDELGDLVRDLENGQDVLVYAPRRYGKSSLVLRAAQEALALLHTMLTITTQTEDAAEGIAAFAEKRDPNWKGR